MKSGKGTDKQDTIIRRQNIRTEAVKNCVNHWEVGMIDLYTFMFIENI